MAENWAMSSTKSFRELVVPVSSVARWKDVTVNTGASASTLQDIKVPDICGGYTYQDSAKPQSVCSNRFIYWRTINDVLELVEESLDHNLVGNQVRFRFQDTQILGGISVHESHNVIIILLVTVASVHRLVFPHPLKLQNNDVGYSPSDRPVPSIFYDASLATVTDQQNMHLLTQSGNLMSQLHSAASNLSNDGQALFTFCCNHGSILLVKMPPLGTQGVVQQIELSQSSMMQKLWSGLVPSVIRGGQETVEAASSLVLATFRGEPYIFAVCRDHKLRVWSAKTHECMSIYNLLECCNTLRNAPPATGTGHSIQAVQSAEAFSNCMLCVHLNFPNRNEFCFLQPQMDSGRLHPYHIATVSGTADDLVDYCATEQSLWSLWTNSAGESVVSVWNRVGDQLPNSWVDVIIQPSEGSDVLVPTYMDPREVYIDRIFEPGRFRLQDIQKALNVYKRSLDTTIAPGSMVQITSLKEEVTLAVEDEIRKAAVANEIAEEEYCQLQLDQWSRFYSCCLQYQEVGAKMKGIFTDPITEMTCIIKKGCVSYIRPCDNVEELYHGAGRWSSLDLDDSQKRDLSTLSMCLRIVTDKVTEDVSCHFEHQISMKEPIREIVSQIVRELFFNASTLDGSLETLGALVQTIHNLPESLRIVLHSLDLTSRSLDNLEDSDMMDGGMPNFAELHAGSGGINVITAASKQLAQTGLSALRDLLLLQTAIVNLGENDGVSSDIAEEIQRELMPHTCLLLRSYMVLKWITNQVASSIHGSSIEINVRQLAALEISSGTGLQDQQKLGSVGMQNITVAELFIRGIGGIHARSHLSRQDALSREVCPYWTKGTLGLAKIIIQLLWPMNESLMFPEFLVSSCQYLPLQEYIFRTEGWCELNVSSRMFMLGLCYLHFDEPQKASECFTFAKEGLLRESFLREKLLQSEEHHIRKLEILYYLKVIKQFEEFDVADEVVSLSKIAISVADDDDENLPTLWSKLFKYQLQLGHNEEAYNAMISNPDPSRKKDCLRQLLVTLCERSQLETIVRFNYTDIEEDVVAILESRARSVDIATQNYYDLLFAFHVRRNNFARAGAMMYEHGLRLGKELGGKHGLQRQAQCYLAAMNSLRIGDPNYAWIKNPIGAVENKYSLEPASLQPKRYVGGEEKSLPARNKVQILEIADIEKELTLVDARLRLLNKESGHSVASGPTPGPDEMVGLLVNAGMYDRAITVCRTFNMKLTPIFDSLALKCVNLSKGSSSLSDNVALSRAWDWLQENHVTLPSIRESSASDTAWALLQRYLETYQDSAAQYHRVVVVKLLSHGFPLPSWLIHSYKGLNWSELLRLMTDFDLLEDAVALIIDYVDALMASFQGQENPIYKLKSCLDRRPQCVWLPYTCIDQIRYALKSHQIDNLYSTLLENLEHKLFLYERQMQNLCDYMLEDYRARMMVDG